MQDLNKREFTIRIYKSMLQNDQVTTTINFKYTLMDVETKEDWLTYFICLRFSITGCYRLSHLLVHQRT